MTDILIDEMDIPLFINSLDNYCCLKLQLFLVELVTVMRINTFHFQTPPIF